MIKDIATIFATPNDPAAPRRSQRDWLLVLSICILAVSEPLWVEGPAEWLSIGLTVATACLLPWRRSHPLHVSIFYVIAFIISDVVNTGNLLYSLLLIGISVTYALMRWASGKEAVIGFLVLLLHYAFHNIVFNPELDIVKFTFAMAFWLLIPILGVAMRYRAAIGRRRVCEARRNERAQLARELHDTVAHHVSAIAIHAQAARTLQFRDQKGVIRSLTTIEEIASETLSEMRKIVGALRISAEVETSPQSRIADIEQLARQHTGKPRIIVKYSGRLDSLAPSIQSGLYRIAQEAITNALRHASRANNIDVQVSATEAHVRLSVTDDGRTDPAAVGRSRGYGLIGMKERAALLGGHLEAGPNPERGWSVRATIPTGGV
jgi:signal transduction histidine kinase